MNGSKAFAAGVIGAAVMTILMGLARAAGVPVNLEMMLGSMLTGGIGIATWVLGFAMHLVAGGIIAILYAMVFHAIGRASGGIGLTIAAVHTVISGIGLIFIPAMHPMIPGLMSAPGAFMANLGIVGIFAFAALHLIYGALVGGMYASSMSTRRISARL